MGLKEQRYLVNSGCDDLVLNDRSMNVGKFKYASDIMEEYSNSDRAVVMEKIAEKIKQHFKEDRIRLDDISEEMGIDELEGRKAELERANHSVLQVLSNFSA